MRDGDERRVGLRGGGGVDFKERPLETGGSQDSQVSIKQMHHRPTHAHTAKNNQNHWTKTPTNCQLKSPLLIHSNRTIPAVPSTKSSGIYSWVEQCF